MIACILLFTCQYQVHRYQVHRYSKSLKTISHCVTNIISNTNKYSELLPVSIPTTTWSGSLSKDIKELTIYEDKDMIAFYKPPSYLVQSENINHKIIEKNMKSNTNNQNKYKHKDNNATSDMNIDIEENMIDAYQKIIPSAGIINRIDRPCSGIILFSKTKQASTYLNKVFQDRIIDKQYLCVVNGKIDVGTKCFCHDYLTKSSTLSKVKVLATISNSNNPTTTISTTSIGVDNSSKNHQSDRNTGKVVLAPRNSVEAKLSYESLCVTNRGTEEKPVYQTLLKVHLDTGRKHQIRVQLSHRGHSICGDMKYNAIQKFQWRDIALHSYCLLLPSLPSSSRNNIVEGLRTSTSSSTTSSSKRPLCLTIEPPRIWEKRFGKDIMTVIAKEIQLMKETYPSSS